MQHFLNSFVSRWDGNSYLFLAQNGYVAKGEEKFFIVFPPLYPSLIRLLNFFLQNPALSAFIISSVSFVIGLFIFFKLLKLDYSKQKSLWIVFCLIIFPTSYFFLTAYPESLFFALIVSCLYCVRLKKFKQSYILASLATLTRPFGILIWFSIFIEWQVDKEKNYIDLLLMIVSAALSSLLYLSINYALFKNPFAFQIFLKTHWQKEFTFPWIGITNSWQRGITTSNLNLEYKYIVGFSEAIASTLVYIFILLSILFKKFRLRLSYLVYFLLASMLMTSTSFLLSTPRYLLSIPPFFITLGILTQSKILKIIWGFISFSLLILFSFLFIKGHWVF